MMDNMILKQAKVIVNDLKWHSDPVGSVNFFGTDHILSADTKGNLGVWKYAANKYDFVKHYKIHDGAVFDLRCNLAHNQFATCGEDKKIKIFEYKDILTCKRAIEAKNNGWLNSIVFSPHNKSVITGSDDGSIRAWSLNDGYELKFYGNVELSHFSSVSCVDYASNGEYLASCSTDNTVLLWDLVTKQVVEEILLDEAWASSLAFAPSAQHLLVANRDTSLSAYNIKNLQREWHLEKTIHKELINEVAFHPTGNYFACAGSDGNVSVWDFKKAELYALLAGHDSSVMSVDFSLDGKKLVSSDIDGVIKVWSEPTLP